MASYPVCKRKHEKRRQVKLLVHFDEQVTTITYMMEETVAFGKVDNVDMYGVHELERILHAEVEPLQVSVAICVVSHEAIEGVIRPHPHLVQICRLEVRIEGQDGLGRVSV